jgi:ADP-ribose pyrophosphatase YjhB (NUDIX family)
MDNLSIELKKLIKEKFAKDDIVPRFLQKISEGNLTRDENPQSHFCLYFAAYDPKAKQIFIGHHKKSGFWLVNGGHVDEGEIYQETLKREIGEEWGINYKELNVGKPQLLTITEINNLPKQPCRIHYDIWYFVNVNRNTFNPDKNKLAEEYFENRWVDLRKARKSLVKELNHLRALNFIENNLLK